MRTYSILRTKEDLEISQLQLFGRTIDLGGYRGSSYFSLLQSSQPVEVANFDGLESKTHHKAFSGADHIFDLEETFPLESSAFDNVLCINVMEHIYNYRNLLSESFRILKKGGHMYLSVPFFFNIHGSPHDYFRYTGMALERLLKDTGFTQVTVTVLGDGPCSAIFQTFGGSIPTTSLKLLFKNIAIGIDQVCSRFSDRYASVRNRVPLGYFVTAYKE